MRVLLQRVTSAQVAVGGEVVGAIGAGVLALIGIAEGDGAVDAEWVVKKICTSRLWEVGGRAWTGSVESEGLAVLAVSQFTLHAGTRKPRPDFHRAMPPGPAADMFAGITAALAARLGAGRVATGVFGAMMSVSLVNDGPVTIMCDSRNLDGGSGGGGGGSGSGGGGGGGGGGGEGSDDEGGGSLPPPRRGGGGGGGGRGSGAATKSKKPAGRDDDPARGAAATATAAAAAAADATAAAGAEPTSIAAAEDGGAAHAPLS